MAILVKPITAQFIDNTIRLRTGGFSISGKVTKNKLPFVCRVRLFERSTGNLISEVPTDDDGNYTFNSLQQVKFFIVAHDPTGKFNAVIQDMVTPK